MAGRLIRIGLVASLMACAWSQRAVAQEKREPEGGPLPPYAKVYKPSAPRAPGAAVARTTNGLPNIVVTGYWPPTNEMLRRFSNNPGQNPEGWVGENWEGRFYNVYAFFPEFPSGLGKGEGDFEVDYQDTSNDWWAIVPSLEPVAIITFGRADADFDWELEGGHHLYPVGGWGDDYLAPVQPTPGLPVVDQETPGTDRWSTLPLQAIVDAVEAAVPALYAYHTTIDDSNFLCDFIGYHATWYHDDHADPLGPAWNVAAGHIHVGSRMELADAITATEVTLRTLVEYLDTQLPMRGDFDGDRDVDDSDAAEFFACFTGAGGGPVAPSCVAGDFDRDDDVDCTDWEAFKLGWTAAPAYPPFFSTCDLDCNGNSVADEFDVEAGTSQDCNRNVVPDECETGCVTASDDDVDNGEAVLLNPGGGSGDPTDDALVEFTNQSGAGGASVAAIETVDPVHGDEGGYAALDTTLIVETSLADGQFLMTVAVPFDLVELGGADPLSVDLVWFDQAAGAWTLAVAANTQPSPGSGSLPVGDRFAQSGAATPALSSLSNDLGDYGVFWNTATLKGFAWANVDHATDFAVAVPVCSAARAVEPEATVVAKGRYFSLVPANAGRTTALRVTLSDLPAAFAGYEGETRWVGIPQDISETSGIAGPTPPTFRGATLQCAPYYADWGKLGLVHVYSDAVVPGAVYSIQAIDGACDVELEENYSTGLAVGTSKWGDAVGTNNQQPPNGTVDFNDISSVVDKFKNVPSAPIKARVDVAPDTPDRIIDFVDIPAVVDAFKGRPYPYDGPAACP